MQLYMSWNIRSFFGFTFLNILYFFKYSCTNIFHRRSLYTFYLTQKLISPNLTPCSVFPMSCWCIASDFRKCSQKLIELIYQDRDFIDAASNALCARLSCRFRCRCRSISGSYNTFRITGPLWGGSTSISLWKGQWCGKNGFLFVFSINKLLNKHSDRRWFETPLRAWDVTVMEFIELIYQNRDCVNAASNVL